MNNMAIALEITLLGMGLVFAAIVLLWWMMNLLTAVTADKPSASDSGAAAPIMDSDLKAQAAAAAVAIAFAEQQNSVAHPLSEPPTAIVSAWQLGMRTRQLYEKRAPTIKPRKAG
ncbi:MAG: OadG family protein [Methanothrix sp.]|nr:OadG family protein [Methanothrix sp.]